MQACCLKQCNEYKTCLWDCGRTMDNSANLTELEILSLDIFRNTMLEAAEKAIEQLKLEMPRFDNIINAEDFMNEIDTTVDNYTYETMMEDEEEEETDEDDKEDEVLDRKARFD
jgi:hypothetical protein